jgi:cysteine desulfurase/selenocysteine lyase
VKPLDPAALRPDFPILSRTVHGKRLVYLDNAATTQKPASVISAHSRFYETINANIHRGVHTLAGEATEAYESTRIKVAKFLGMPDERGVVFVRNATEAINLVAYSWALPNLKPGDEILATEMEHHSNLVPWIRTAEKTGASLKHVKVTADGRLDMGHFRSLLSSRTKLVAVTQVSNVLGTINPVAEIAAAAHAAGARVLVDGAQSVPHMPVGFAGLGCDWLAFSAHKMLGPTGVGVLAARPETLEAMEPFQYGGSMIREVGLNHATWNDVPWKFEAGTPNIAGVAAFGAALDYLTGLGLDAVRAHEEALTGYALERLRTIPGLKVFGPPEPAGRGGVISFSLDGIHPHDIATVLDDAGVAIRAGHHCAQPLMQVLGVVATARASFYVYNGVEDVDALIESIKGAIRYFGPGNA